MSDADNPLDPFRRATTATIRAIAGNDELDVTFGAGPPVVRGGVLRLPLPAVGARQSEIDAVRGVGDEFAYAFAITMPVCMPVTARKAGLRKKCLSGSSRRESPPLELCACRVWRRTSMPT
jgi:cobalamin biosynthesis protein CobT